MSFVEEIVSTIKFTLLVLVLFHFLLEIFAISLCWLNWNFVYDSASSASNCFTDTKGVADLGLTVNAYEYSIERIALIQTLTATATIDLSISWNILLKSALIASNHPSYKQ